MFTVLNRLAWCMSFLLGALLLDFFARGIGIYFREIWFIIFIGAGLLCKHLFFSESFIRSAIENSEGFTKKSNNTSELIIEKKVEETPYELSDDDFFDEDEYDTQPVIKNIAQNDSSNNLQSYEPTAFDLMLESWSKNIRAFFSENVLAKLGGILIFLGVLFFLGLVYNSVGNVLKMIIGLAFGFTLYGVGVWLDTKSITNESRILMGIGILVNYLVILSGRYLLGGEGFVSEGMTFVFLILNTVFAVVTSMVYKSKVLLIFAFIVAYLNPILVGGSSATPYTLLGYTLIVSFGALFLSAKNKNITLLILSLLFGNFFILVAPESAMSQAVIKMISLNLLNVAALYVATKFSDSYKLILEILFAGLFFMLGFFIFGNLDHLENMTYMVLALLSGFLVVVLGYAMSFRKPYLYAIATAGGVMTFASLIVSGFYEYIGTDTQSMFMLVSVASIVVFSLMNWILPFLHKTLMSDRSHSNSFLIGNITSLLFIAAMLFMYGNEFFPGISLGIAFLILAGLYAGYLFMFIQKFGFDSIKKDTSLQNSLYMLSGIVASLVAIAIAYIFSKYPEIIGTLWLFESTLIFYFFSKKRDWKLYTAGLILFIIGVSKFALLLDVVEMGDYTILVSLAIVFISLVLNIKFISPKLTDEIEPYDFGHCIFHVSAAIIFIALIVAIVPSSQYGWSTLVVSIFIALLGVVYGYFNSRLLKYGFVIAFGLFGLYQIGEFSSTIARIDRNEREYLRILQYTTSLFMVVAYFVYNKFNTLKTSSGFVLGILGIYLFIITTLYVEDIFNSSFAITIYWGILAFILLMRGIGNNIIKLRTLGLYIVTLTAGKIFLYDIWYGLSNGVSRVVALIFVGILLIIISTRYTKKYGNNLKGEFKLENIFSSSEKKSVNESIKDIDVSEYKAVRFIGKDGSKTQVRAVNLIKIVKMLVNKYDKAEFTAGELTDIYEDVMQNYTSHLSQSQLKSVTNVVEKFVQTGGSVEFITK